MNTGKASLVICPDSTASPASPATPTLAGQEKIIRDAHGSAVYATGGALLAIRDHRLYRTKGYERFQDYCEQVWGFGRSRADQFISFYLIVHDLSTNVDMRGVPLPRSEAQTRPLLRLVLQRHFCVRTALLVKCSGHSATFVLPQSDP